MIFSIIIPSVNNFNYLKLTIKSIKKYSKFNHQIIVSLVKKYHTTKHKHYFEKNNIDVVLNYNKGLCTSINNASKYTKNNYLLISDDDMFFLPDWDVNLIKVLNSYNHNNLFLSSTCIQPKNFYKKKFFKYLKKNPTTISYNSGTNIDNFDKNKIIKNYKNFFFPDWSGTHHTPFLISKKLFNKVDGFSNEFNPGDGSDADFCHKLWNENIRIFRGVGNSRVYHFGSITTRKNNKIKLNNGNRIFLRKWGYSTNFFMKFYLKRGSEYKGRLSIKKNLFFYISLLFEKIKYFIY